MKSMRGRRFFLFAFIITLIGVCFFVRAPFLAGWKFLGFDRPKEYLVLFQNNMEIRSSGGFLGSFGRIRVEKGKISLLKIEDIYVPDGQIGGHVDPPWPIQAAFGQGWWKLRDSNWDPDFPTSAKTIEWFFSQGKEPKADGLIAVNLSLLQGLLQITGPVYVLDEPEKISFENFYKKTQSAVENGFFPGSVQKGNFLAKLGKAVFASVMELPPTKKIQLPFLGLRLLSQKEILLFSHDGEAQTWFHQNGFDGSLADIRHTGKDYLAVFENNLGANKANCCVKRDVKLKDEQDKEGQLHTLSIHYENTNPTSLKKPPQYWGGAYVNFLRIGVPIDATIVSIKVGETNYPVPRPHLIASQDTTREDTITDLMKKQSDDDARKFVTGEDSEHTRVDVDKREDKGIQFIGFFIFVDALTSKDVIVTYRTAQTTSLVIQKQSGIQGTRYTVEKNNQSKEIILSRDLAL